MTSVLIADDQALVRVGLRKILENDPRTTVAGEAVDGEDAVQAARRLSPDVVLMDIRMPVLDGIEATRRIVRARSETRVLILTTFGLDSYVYDSLRAGASGFMLKDAPPEEITAAVEIVANGDALLAPAVTRAVIEEFARTPSSTPAPSPARRSPNSQGREREVLRPPRAWTIEPRDLRRTRHLRGNGENARRSHPPETRPPRPHPGRHLCVRKSARHARVRFFSTAPARIEDRPL